MEDLPLHELGDAVGGGSLGGVDHRTGCEVLHHDEKVEIVVRARREWFEKVGGEGVKEVGERNMKISEMLRYF